MRSPAASVLKPLLIRLLYSLVSLWAVTVIFFAVTEMMPGDFASATASRDTPEEYIEAVRDRLGLRDPPVERYFDWVTGMMAGDFGHSWFNGREILPLIGSRLQHSAWLIGWSVLLTVPIALGLAVASVYFYRRPFDNAASIISLTTISLPEFIVAYALLGLLAAELRIFPAFTAFSDQMSLAERLYASALPILSLAFVTITPMFRLARAALVNVMAADYIQMAKLKGITRWRLLTWHAGPNAAGPVAVVVVQSVANLFFGLVIIEIIFGYPGLGSLLLTGVSYRDMPLVLACALITAFLYISLNLFADWIAILTNPRMKDAGDKGFAFRFMVDWEWTKPKLVFAGTAAVAALVYAAIQLAPDRWRTVEPVDIVSVEAPSGQLRMALTRSQLLDPDYKAFEPVHYDYFRPMGAHGPARHRFEGRLQIRRFQIQRRKPGTEDRPVNGPFLVLDAEFTTDGDILLPVKFDRLQTSRSRRYNYILGPGRIWHEEADGDWSRAAFPFTWTSALWVPGHYGVISFLFNDTGISGVRVQTGQEAHERGWMDFWGQGKARYTPRSVEGAAKAKAAYRDAAKSRLDIRPWSDLEAAYGASLEDFDGRDIRRHVTVSALMIDDIVYLRDCRTRFGPHPFCREIRHSVYSVSKSMGNALSLLWLAGQFGESVMHERIIDHIRIDAEHDGWKDVTFKHALDMVTGVGDVVPERVEEYVETDSSPYGRKLYRSRSLDRKLQAVAAYPNYPWGPGEVLRYDPVAPLVLTAAMQSFYEKKAGTEADLWDAVTENVLKPLGIDHIPVKRTLPQGGKRGLPIFDRGLYPTFEEALKVARLFQDEGRHDGKQLLHRELTRHTVSNEMERGYRSYWEYPEGGEAHYENSFWLIPHLQWLGCDVRIPTMVGHGGNYVAIMPNRTIGLRFADGHDDHPDTYDSYGIRDVSNRIRPFCG